MSLTEDEVAVWPLKRLVRWMAFFKIVREEENKAIEKARTGANKPTPFMTV